MKFRLSTLLLVVTLWALLFTQHASAERTFYVATLETAILALWAADRERHFPLIALVNLATGCVLIHGIGAYMRLATPITSERILQAVDATFPMVLALYGSVAFGYLTHRAARALIRQRRALVLASIRAVRQQHPVFRPNAVLRAPAPRRYTQFHLSTLMAIVTAAAILISQRHSIPRFAAVGVLEMVIAFGWMAAVGHPFPWNAVVGGALAIELLAFPISFLMGIDVRMRFPERVANSVVVTAAAGIVLALVIGLLYLSYSVVKDPFRTYAPNSGAFRRRRRS